MANRVRGIRQKLPANVILGRLNGAGGPAQAITLDQLAANVIQRGGIPVSGGGGALTVGSTVINSGTTNRLLYDNSGVLGEAIVGTGLSLSGGTLTASGVTFTDQGAWSGGSAYNPGDVAQHGGSAFLCYKAIAAPGGSTPTLDGSVSGTIGNNNTSKTLSLTTSGAGFVVVCVAINPRSNTLGVNVVTSVTAAGLTFSKRGQLNHFDNASSAMRDIEIWYADNTLGSAFSGNITVNLENASGAGGPDTGSVVMFGVANLVGWDSDVSLPASAAAATVNYNTSDAQDMVLSLIGGNLTNAGTPPSPSGVPGGGTLIAAPRDSSGFENSQCTVYYGTSAGSISGGAITANASDNDYLCMVDALTNSGASNPSPDTDDTHWVSQGAGGSSGITVGTTTITSGTNTRVLYDNSGVVGEYSISGTGNVAMTTSPTFTTPALGTPSALVLTNATGLVTAGINASQVTYAKIQNVAAHSLLGNPTGSAAAPSEITLGANLSFSGTTLVASGGSSGITIGTTTITSGTSGRVLYDNSGVVGEMTTTGSGTVLVLATSPSLVTPALGTPSSGTLTNCTGLPNAGLVNSSITIAGHSVSLGGTQTLATTDLTDVANTTWTPSDQSGASLTFTGVSASYTRIGNMVFAYAQLSFPSTADGSAALIGGLPFTAANANYAKGSFNLAGPALADSLVGIIVPNSKTFHVYDNRTGAFLTNAQLSTTAIIFTAAYPIA